MAIVPIIHPVQSETIVTPVVNELSVTAIQSDCVIIPILNGEYMATIPETGGVIQLRDQI